MTITVNTVNSGYKLQRWQPSSLQYVGLAKWMLWVLFDPRTACYLGSILGYGT